MNAHNAEEGDELSLRVFDIAGGSTVSAVKVPARRRPGVVRTNPAKGTAGNLTTDAHLAALAIEHGAELCSTDADFARFKLLRRTNPLS